MEPKHVIVSPSLLQQFDKFAKSGVVKTGLELDDFIDVPLSMPHAIDDNTLLVASRQFEEKQQVLERSAAVSTSMAASVIDKVIATDIDKLLLAASQQFKLQSEACQPSCLQQDSGASTAILSTDEIVDKLLLGKSQQFEQQFKDQGCSFRPICEGLKSDSVSCNSQFASPSCF